MGCGVCVGISRAIKAVDVDLSYRSIDHARTLGGGLRLFAQRRPQGLQLQGRGTLPLLPLLLPLYYPPRPSPSAADEG